MDINLISVFAVDSDTDKYGISKRDNIVYCNGVDSVFSVISDFFEKGFKEIHVCDLGIIKCVDKS